MNHQDIARHVGVDDVDVRHKLDGISVTLTYKGRTTTIEFDYQRLKNTENMAKEMGREVMQAAFDLRTKVEMDRYKIDTATGADLDRIAMNYGIPLRRIEDIPRDVFRNGYDVEEEEKRHASRFEAIAEELKKL